MQLRTPLLELHHFKGHATGIRRALALPTLSIWCSARASFQVLGAPARARGTLREIGSVCTAPSQPENIRTRNMHVEIMKKAKNKNRMQCRRFRASRCGTATHGSEDGCLSCTMQALHSRLRPRTTYGEDSSASPAHVAPTWRTGSAPENRFALQRSRTAALC